LRVVFFLANAVADRVIAVTAAATKITAAALNSGTFGVAVAACVEDVEVVDVAVGVAVGVVVVVVESGITETASLASVPPFPMKISFCAES